MNYEWQEDQQWYYGDGWNDYEGHVDGLMRGKGKGYRGKGNRGNGVKGKGLYFPYPWQTKQRKEQRIWQVSPNRRVEGKRN